MLMLRDEDDVKAFDELALRYKDRIMNFLIYYTKDYHDAEDLTQESFLKLFRQRSRYKDIGSFSTWIYTIAKNTARDKYDKTRNIKSVSFEEVDESELETGDLIYEHDDFELADEFELKRDCLKRSFEQLEDIFKEVILLRFYEEFEYEKISEILCIPVGTVKSRVNRGREHLKIIFIKICRD